MNQARARRLTVGLTELAAVIALSHGCVTIFDYGHLDYRNPELRSSLEEELSSRELDPIEGFWESSSAYYDSIGAIHRVDPATNNGFPFACHFIELKGKGGNLYRRFDKTQVRGRWKAAGTPNVYQGQALTGAGSQEFWMDGTCTLIDPTILEVTYHATGPVGGGNRQRAHLIGPSKELERRLQATAQASQAKSGVPIASSRSGFVIGRSLVVTCHHVIRDAKAIRCFVSDKAFSAALVAHDPQSDLALLRLDDELQQDVPTLTLGNSGEILQGERVYAMGFPLTDVLGIELHVHEGIVSSVVGFGGRASEFQVEMSLNPGNSGGPLLDAGGRVIGIVASKLGLGYAIQTGTIPEGVTFATKADLLRPLISAAGASSQVAFDAAKPSPMKLEDVTATLGRAVVRVEADR